MKEYVNKIKNILKKILRRLPGIRDVLNKIDNNTTLVNNQQKAIIELAEALESKVAELFDTLDHKSTELSDALESKTNEVYEALEHRTTELSGALEHKTIELSNALNSNLVELSNSLNNKTMDLSNKLESKSAESSYAIEEMKQNMVEIRSMTNEAHRAIAQLNVIISGIQTYVDEQFSNVHQEIIRERASTELDNMSIELDGLDKKLIVCNDRMTSLQFGLKKLVGAPIKVVFLLEEPSVIKNVLCLIETLSNDERYDVLLINLWYKVYNGQNFTYKRPNIESVIDEGKYNVIDSYDEESDTWIELEKLLPDYVFFSRPYDYYRQEAYHIGNVSQYARTCYIPYGIQTIGGDVEKMVLTPECKHLYYFFMDNAIRGNIIKNVLGNAEFIKKGRLLYLGYPGIDMMLKCKAIQNVNDCIFTVLWLPRWNDTENNCHFFDYKDVLVEYASQYDDSRIILRPHPLCFEHFIQNGKMQEEELVQLREKYRAPNMIDETNSYIESFEKSSVLVADETSLIAEYYLTGKPIVFCRKETHFSLLMEKLIEGCYVVDSPKELIDVLKQLKDGKDTLKIKREEITKANLLDFGVSASDNIKEELWHDFTCD